MNVIDKKQLAIIIFFVSIVFKITSLPSYLYEIAGRTSIMSVLFIVLLEFAMLLLVLFIVSRGGMRGIKKLYGEMTYRLVSLPFLLVFGVKMLVFLSEINEHARAFMFYHIPTVPIVLTLLFTIFYIASKGAKSVGRLFGLCIWAIPIILLLGILFGGTESYFTFLTPLFDEGFSPVFNSMTKYLIYCFDFSPLLFISIQNKKGAWVLLSCLLSVITLMGIYVLFITNYGNFSPLNTSAFASLSSFNIVISEVGSLDWPTGMLWMAAAVLSLALSAVAVGEILKSFKIHRTHAIGGFCALIAVLYIFAFTNQEKILQMATGGIQYAVYGIQVVIPIVLLVLYYIKHKKGDDDVKHTEDIERNKEQKLELEESPKGKEEYETQG